MQYRYILPFVLLSFLLVAPAALAAGLIDQVPKAFTAVYGRKPTATELTYWNGRVKSGDKKTYDALVGAMGYQKQQAATTSAVVGKTPAGTTNKETLIKDVLPIFITIFGKNPTNTEKAWWRARISCGELKSSSALIASMNFHKSKGKRMGADTICGGAYAAAKSGGSSSSSSGISRRSIAGVSDNPNGDNIRVGIFHTTGKTPIEVSVNSNYQIRAGGDKVLATLDKDDVVKVSYSGGKYHVRGSGIEEDTSDIIRITPLNSGIVQLINYSDPSKTYPGKNYNRFRGVMEIRRCDNCDELWAINELRLELYLRGLAETSGEGPEEYIKALGIAARTYALYHKVVTGGRSVHKDYDISNTADDQLYRGYEYEIIAPRLGSIIGQTKGIIATNSEGDVPISTIYFSDSDGRTRTAKEAWNTSRFPYLQKSVKDPYHVSKTCLGHCVGMSAQGAFGFAKAEGWDFKKILNYYYQDIKLVKAY